nr:Asp23/Gls24 family envelope stress response protein [uncultured Peptostreptococcus sp.]
MEYKDNVESKSKLIFEEQVIAKIVAMAIKGQDGITTVKSNGAFSGIVGRGNESSGINVEVGEEEVAVDLRLWLEFGKNARDIYTKLKEIIEEQVMSMTGLRVVEVNAKIEDVLSPDEFRDRLNG